ncbi:hypothetical protein [Arenivirga flava]|uniref:Uncharacterized protein n=1 Tax=Arenivirga flava TaxID=1930060 RepID=A0AA37XBX1_9MICO|nr:hypothetical protein [Arenivirga flava]GMA28875.1 hypothetical protein GCM10025874_21280 [Arenivirga flava]
MSTSSLRTTGQQRLLSLLAGVSICVMLGAVGYTAIIPATGPQYRLFAAAFAIGWPIAILAALAILWPVQILLEKLDLPLPVRLIAAFGLAALLSAIISIGLAITIGNNGWLLFMLLFPATVVSGVGGLLVGSLFQRLARWLQWVVIGAASACWVASIYVLLVV